jgi:hypothetical protein
LLKFEGKYTRYSDLNGSNISDSSGDLFPDIKSNIFENNSNIF